MSGRTMKYDAYYAQMNTMCGPYSAEDIPKIKIDLAGLCAFARKMGKKRIIAETGAGQHGVATATACALMDMPCTVYMGATDVARQRPNVERSYTSNK